MFQVINPETSDIHNVYDVKEKVVTKVVGKLASSKMKILFLVYKDGMWVYDDADNYYPVLN